MLQFKMALTCVTAVYVISLVACKSRQTEYIPSALECENARRPCDGSKMDLLGTKTLYWIQQDPQTYDNPPSGYEPIFVNVLSRHSSRGLAKPSSDLTLYNLVEKAKAEKAATQLALSLSEDMLELMGINAFLGENIEGMSPAGYGNLSRQGIEEHTGLGARLYKRMEPLFSNLTQNNSKNPQRNILVTYSGAPRTVDSAHFFGKGLIQNNPALSSLIKLSEPAGKDSANPGENSYTMHFHDLNATDNPPPSPDSPLASVLQDSLAYQAYKQSQEYQDKIASIRSAAAYQNAAKTVLSELFSQDFIDKIADGTHKIDNSGQVTVKNRNGQSTIVSIPAGKKPTAIKDLLDIAEKIFDVYAIAAPLHYELNGKNYSRYLPLEQAKQLSLLQDAEDFYDIGPGMQGADPATYRMAQGLLDDMFAQVDAIATGNLANAASLRFSHAEVLVPLVSILGIEGYSDPLPDDSKYSYENSQWRGRVVAPLMGNIQWDVYRNNSQQLAVRMLLNEKEVDFRRECASAKINGSAKFYDYSKLKDCYEEAKIKLTNREMPRFTAKKSTNKDKPKKTEVTPRSNTATQTANDAQNMTSSQTQQNESCKSINRDGDTCAAINAREGEQVCHWDQKWVCENGCAKWLAASCSVP